VAESDQSSLLLLGGLLAALALFLLDLVLTVAMVAASALNRVALQRLRAEAGGRLRFLADFRNAPSSHRTAAHLARQLSLLAGVLVLGTVASAAGWSYAGMFGTLGGAIVGVLLLEVVVARGIALRWPRGALRFSAPVVWSVHALLYPLVGPLVGMLRPGETAQSGGEEERDEDQEEEVDALIEVGEREGILEAAEGRMMRSIADLDDTLVREIMTPRTDILALPKETTLNEARRALIEGHSRVPVYRDNIDNVVGVLHARDLFRAWEEGQDETSIEPYLRPALFVPETLSVADLLARMRLRTKIALVVDEYGGTAGLVTLEDLLEEIVGDIRDEHDLDESPVTEQADGSWLVSGVAHVEELESLFDVEFGERDFDTVGGLVVAGFGRVPRKGETLRTRGLIFEIVEADPKRVYRVRVGRTASGDEAGTGA